MKKFYPKLQAVEHFLSLLHTESGLHIIELGDVRYTYIFDVLMREGTGTRDLFQVWSFCPYIFVVMFEYVCPTFYYEVWQVYLLCSFRKLILLVQQSENNLTQMFVGSVISEQQQNY